MSLNALILLSPYRLPAQHAGMFSNDDVSAWLNGYTCLWHPAALWRAAAPPRIGSPYDYEQPTRGHIYAVPDSPPLILPDDWEERVRTAGAVSFHATPDREATLANLKEALRALGQTETETYPTQEGVPEAVAPPAWSAPLGALLDLEPARVAPFFGIGFGHLHVEGLFEAMEHENLLASTDLWQDIQQAIAALGSEDPETWRKHLKTAAERLQAAREVLYPVTIHLLDLTLLEEARLGEPLPATLEQGLPLNIVAAASLLEKLGREHPERIAMLREKVANDQVEVCGGPYVEREEALLPVESQLWNLTKGMSTYQALLGQEIKVFARRRFGAHPQLPLYLNSVGLHRALLLAFDDATLPAHRTCMVNWPSPDGKQVEAFARTPYAAENPQTYFHIAHYLHKTIMQDHAGTLALLHRGTVAPPWYRDWLELSRLAPVLGQWTTFTRYFNDVLSGEYTAAAPADEFHGDYLSERTNDHHPNPVSGFARHARQRRRLDTLGTLAALHRGLAGASDSLRLETRLADLETGVESSFGAQPAENEREAEFATIENEVTTTLAQRLLSRAADGNPGYLVLNPCNFLRRVPLELDGITSPLPTTGPIKACQIDGDKARLVVEVPALGFAWFPSTGTPGAAPARRMRMADEHTVRNEFFEAEIDKTTGGLRGIRDHRTRVNRLGQQLVFNPGCVTRAKEVRVISTGPALGEVISEGAILDEQERVLATFRQRFRAWLSRPVLDLRIEIFPEHLPQGYPWHAYYGARFAWRDERATLLRGVNGMTYVTSHTRPESADYVELRLGKQSTTLFPGGLPFHQRQGGRMLDVILLPEGETARTFDLALGLDREQPMQTALGMITPVPLMATTKGPPHVGATGWLFHLDATNLVLTGMRPAADGADAVTARLLECFSHGSQAEFRCPRNPVHGVLQDARGMNLLEASVQGDAALFEVSPCDFVQLRVEFQ